MSDVPREEPRPADAAPVPVVARPTEPLAAGEAPEAAPESGLAAVAPAEPPAPTAPPELAELKPAPPALAAPKPAPPPAPRRGWLEALAERPEVVIEIPARRLQAQSRRDFMLLAAGLVASAAGAWWLLPDRTRARLLPGPANDRLDTLAARVGLSRANREKVLDRSLTFDDDVAEALYSKSRRVRTYSRSRVRPLRNNYNGQTPGPEYLPGWTLGLAGLASGRTERFTIDDLLRRFPQVEQVTRLVCVEGWSAVAWWGGIRFADVVDAFPPAPGARWAALRSAVNLDGVGRSDPYYVSIDLKTARHPQTLLATHQGGAPLTLGHGAPMRLLVPMKLGLKNIKAVTDIVYMIDEPEDYWNERGYSKYDGL